MENFLSGRKQAFRVELPVSTEEKEGLEALNVLPLDEETVDSEQEDLANEELVQVEAPEDAVNPPEVEVLLRDGVVQKIFITCDNGQYIELQCDYSKLEEDIETEVVEEELNTDDVS